MKQTALEWLLNQIQQKLYIRDNVIEQAKEMEKQQIIDAVDETNRKWGSKNAEVLLSGKQYYNETFNK
jgi:hypothetical protein